MRALTTRGQSAGNTHLDPTDELGDVTAHQFGEGSRHGVVLVSPGQPVHHDHVGAGLTLVEGGHQLGHPALEHPSYLQPHTELLFGFSCFWGQLQRDQHCSGHGSHAVSWRGARGVIRFESGCMTGS